MAHIRGLKEPDRGNLIPLPEALKILESMDPKDADTVGARTYSTHLNEKSLQEKYGAPANTGTFRGLKTLHYGWLEIAVISEGEIAYIVRVLNPKKEEEVQIAIIIEGKP